MENIRKTLYIETTIPSYGSSKESRHVISAGKQALTKLFWEQERHKYDLKISEFVLQECQQGNPDAVQRRLDFLIGIPVLPQSPEIISLGLVYQKLLQIPEYSKTDAFHLATCVLARIDFLLSWNCTHLGTIANNIVKHYNDEYGLWTPVLVTPEALITVMEADL